MKIEKNKIATNLFEKLFVNTFIEFIIIELLPFVTFIKLLLFWNLQKEKINKWKTSMQKNGRHENGRETIEKEESVARGERGGEDLEEDKTIRLIWITRFPFLPMPAA